MSQEIPAVLYKYRTWSDPNHQKLLTNRELWFSSPKGFNDPFDTKLRTSFNSLSDRELEDLLYHKLRLHSPTISEAAAQQQARKRTRELRNPLHLRQLHEVNYEQAAAFFGFVSLAEEADNILLWAHYASSHSGFVIGFDTRRLHEDVGGIFQRVSYQPAYPLIVPGAGGEDDTRELLEVLNTKAALWEYEKEVRLTKPGGSNKALRFQPETVAEIVIGCATPADHRQQLVAAAQAFPQAALFQAAVSDEDFALSLQRLR